MKRWSLAGGKEDYRRRRTAEAAHGTSLSFLTVFLSPPVWSRGLAVLELAPPLHRERERRVSSPPLPSRTSCPALCEENQPVSFLPSLLGFLDGGSLPVLVPSPPPPPRALLSLSQRCLPRSSSRRCLRQAPLPLSSRRGLFSLFDASQLGALPPSAVPHFRGTVSEMRGLATSEYENADQRVAAPSHVTPCNLSTMGPGPPRQRTSVVGRGAGPQSPEGKEATH